ncbi:MAG: xylulokinase [Candidatus Caldatribacteriaceae bacterium]
MKEIVVLVLDLGTESVRAALVSEEGAILSLKSKNLDFYSPHAGWAEQDPEEWWSASIQCIREVLSTSLSFEVLAVGITAQMHAVVPLGDEGQVLMDRVPIWCDKRSAEISFKLQKEISLEEQIERTANLLIPNWIGPKIRWIRDNLPEIYQKTAVFLPAKDFLNHRLTKSFYTDFSEASGTFLFSWKNKDWDEDLLDFLGVDGRKLPSLVSSSQVVGQLKDDVARILGLPSGTPVICGAGDMLCLLLGGGMTEYGRSCDVSGTAADVSICTPFPLLTSRLMNLHHAIEGWISFGILDSGWWSIRWLREAFYAFPEVGLQPYSFIDEEAQKVSPGSDGLLFFPYLMGERLFGSPWARGVFFGILPMHRRGHFARAAMEGVSFDLKMSLEEIERLWGREIKTVNAIGGGAKSDLWCQIKADIYGKEIVALEESEGGVMGVAMLTFSGVTGESIASISERWLKIRKRFLPEPSSYVVYHNQYSLFKTFHDLFQEAFAKYRGED